MLIVFDVKEAHDARMVDHIPVIAGRKRLSNARGDSWRDGIYNAAPHDQ